MIINLHSSVCRPSHDNRYLFISFCRLKKEVERCRDVIAGLALLRPGVTFTLYDRSTRSFIAKYIKGRSQVQSISQFFNCTSPEDLTQLRAISAGNWTVAGWAMRPPQGHPNTSRQRIFINNYAVKAPALSKSIDEIFTESYRAIIKVQGRAPSADLLSLRKATNLHSMFLLDLQCPPEVIEVLPEPGGGTVLLEDWTPVVAAVRNAVLSAWDSVLNSALLSEVESHRGHREDQVEAAVRHASVPRREEDLIAPQAGASPSVFLPSSSGPWSKSAPSRLGNGRTMSSHILRAGPLNHRTHRNPSNSIATNNGEYNRNNKPPEKQQSSVLRLPPQSGEPPRAAYSTGSGISRQQLSSASTIRGVDAQALPPLLPPRDPYLPSSSSNSLLQVYRHRRETSRPRMAEGSALASLPKKRPRSSTPSASLASLSGGTGTGLHPLSLGQETAPTAPPAAPSSALDVILSTWRNPAMMPAATGASQTVATLDGLSSAVFARLRPEALAREDLQGARALHQVECKFIPIISSTGKLALVDQHAADERVQLEKLKAQIVSPSGGPAGGTCPSLQLPQPQPLRLGADEVPLFAAYGEAAVAWGWRWVVYRASACAPEALAEVTAVPLVATRGLTATDLRLYLHDMATTHGGAGPPAGIIRILNSIACRSAIMFGDELVPAQCQDLVDALEATQMCFVCAHGRPTTVPLVDLVAAGKAAAVLQASRARPNGGGGVGLRGLKFKLKATLEN